MAAKPIYVYLTEEEKSRLQALASERNTSMSSLVKEQILIALDSADMNEEELDFPEAFQPNDDIADAKRSQVVKIYLTPDELSYIKRATVRSGRKTLSAFARNAMLSACGGRLEISVNTNDLEELNDLVAQVNMHIQGFLGALRFRSEVQKADIEYIDKQLDNINDGVQKLNREILRNRYSIRQQGRRSVEKQVRQLLSYTQKRGDNRDSD